MSGYAVTAQFYDAVGGDQHAGVDAQITAALDGLDTSAGPVVDIGAGTGLTTQLIAHVLPKAEILAIEPDPAMRPALMTRVWSNPDLRRRVSILPMSVLNAPLPPLISGAVASASLVHLAPQERVHLWTLLASRLAPVGRLLVEIQCPAAIDVPKTHMATSRIGRVTYEGWAEATRLDDTRQRWRMTYVTLLDGAEIDRQSAEYVCWTIGGQDILIEARAAGLEGSISDELVILTPQA